MIKTILENLSQLKSELEELGCTVSLTVYVPDELAEQIADEIEYGEYPITIRPQTPPSADDVGDIPF